MDNKKKLKPVKDIHTAHDNRHEEIKYFNVQLNPKGYNTELLHTTSDLDKNLGEKKRDNKLENRNYPVTRRKAMGFTLILTSSRDRQHQVRFHVRHSNDWDTFFKHPNNQTPDEYLNSINSDWVVFVMRSKGKVIQAMRNPFSVEELRANYDYKLGEGTNKRRISFPYKPPKGEYRYMPENMFGESPVLELIKVFKQSKL